MVAEHTCGVDIKSYLRDETAWDRTDFEAARKSDYRFAYAEASWAEQRAYLDGAVEALDGVDRAVGLACVVAPEAESEFEPVDRTERLRVGEWTIGFDRASGDVTEIVAPDGTA